ncbi:hypothetical protein JCM1841_004392 [Sporobolomyces salmonicolor]
MTDAAPRHLAFDKVDRLVGAWTATCAVLLDARKVCSSLYAVHDHNELLKRVAVVSASAKHNPRMDSLFVEFWKAQLRCFPKHSAVRFATLAGTPAGIHPLLAATLELNDTQFDEASHGRDETDGIGGARGATTTRRAPCLRTEDLFGDFREAGRAHRLAALAGESDEDVGHGTDDDEPCPDSWGQGRVPYEELVHRTLEEQGNDDEDEDLPEDVRAYRANILHRSIDFHDKALRSSLLVGWCMVAARNLVAVEDGRRITLGESLSFPELCDSRQGSMLDLSEEAAAVYHVQQSLKKATPVPLDPLEWETVFHKWTAILDAVNYGDLFERERKLRFWRYRKHILLELRRNSSPVHRRRVLNYDEAVRSSIASLTFEAPVKHFGAGSTHDLLYFKHVLQPFERPTPPSSRSQNCKVTSPLPAYNWDSPYCWKYNNRQAHSDCTRLHSCYQCGDSSHVFLTCPDLGSGSARSNGVHTGDQKGKAGEGRGGGGQHGVAPGWDN